MAAIPFVTSLASCVDYTSTFGNYLPQLWTLHTRLLEAVPSPTELTSVYVSTNPAIFGLWVSLALAPIFLLASEINKNYSQVDRFWSILPTIYNFHYALYAHLAGLPTARNDLVAVVSLLWSMRLSYNYWRKGGYSIGSEDYRWMIIKDKIGSLGMFVLDVVFIASMQSVLLYAVTLPSYALLLTSILPGMRTLTATDYGLAGLMLSLIALTFVADQQQWDYHAAKDHYKKTAKVPPGYKAVDLERGFLANGLWAYSRHPNFAFEQSIWVTLYLWACQNTNTLYNWTGIGALNYLMLFQGSTWLTELITGGKYPEYKNYQKHVGMFVPGFGGGYSGPAAMGMTLNQKKSTKKTK